MAVVNDQDELLVITENGFGKRTPIGLADAADANAATPEDADANAADANAATPEDADDADNADDAEDTARSSASAWKFRLTRRGGKGVVAIKLRPGDKVVAAFQIEQNTDKEIILTSIQGLMPQYRIADFRLCGRAAYGTIIMRLNEGDKVASAAIVDELSEEEIAANTAKARENAENQAREAEFAARLNALQQQAQQNSDNTDTDDDQQDGDGQ